MKTLTICGSMRFEREMRQIAWELETERGYNVLQCVYHDTGRVPTPEQLERLAAAHYRKIDLSEGIYVVNIGGYIGDSVKAEIAYGISKGKKIIYHEEMEL